MGEVDITIVSRGKNLHVNISSNTAAINTLAINANELKTQLQTSGIQNASLNFNNNEQNNQQASQQQQNRNNERQADEEYSYFENEEQNEEVLSSLEIVVPNYA
jgi:flagellar hook-length control protein FliK